MIVTKPTEAVREKHTVPRGNTRADEFARPAGLVLICVSSTQQPSRARISVSETQEVLPPHQSGLERLGCGRFRGGRRHSAFPIAIPAEASKDLAEPL